VLRPVAGDRLTGLAELHRIALARDIVVAWSVTELYTSEPIEPGDGVTVIIRDSRLFRDYLLRDRGVCSFGPPKREYFRTQRGTLSDGTVAYRYSADD